MEFLKTRTICKRFVPYGQQVQEKNPWYPQEICNDWPHAASALTLGESNVIKYGITFPLRTGLDDSYDENDFVEKTVYLEVNDGCHCKAEEYFVSQGVCLVSHGPIGGPSFIKGLYRPLTSYGTGVGIQNIVKAYFPREDDPVGNDTYICLIEKAGISLYAEESSENHVSHVPEFRIDRVFPCKFGLLVIPLKGVSTDFEKAIYILTNPIKQVSKIWQKIPLNRDYREYENDNESLLWCEKDLCVFWSFKNDKLILRRLVKLGKTDILQSSTLNTTAFTTSQDLSGRAQNFATSSTSLFSPFPKHSLSQPHRSAMRVNKEGSSVCYWPAFDFSNASLPGLGLGFFPPHVCVYDDPELYLSTLFEIELPKGPWREPRKFRLMAHDKENKLALCFLIQNHLYVEGVDISSGSKLSHFALLNISDFTCPGETKSSTKPIPMIVILQTDGSVRVCWLDENLRVVVVSLIEPNYPEPDGCTIKGLDYVFFDCSKIICTLETTSGKESGCKHEKRCIIELRNFRKDGLISQCYPAIKAEVRSEISTKILARFIAGGDSESLNSDWEDFVQVVLGIVNEESGEQQVLVGTQILSVLNRIEQTLKISSHSLHYVLKIKEFGNQLSNFLQQKYPRISLKTSTPSLFSIFYKLLQETKVRNFPEYEELPEVLQILLESPDKTNNLERLSEIRTEEECLAPVFELLLSDVFYRNRLKMKFGKPEKILKLMGRTDYLSGSSIEPSLEPDRSTNMLGHKEVDEFNDDPTWTNHILLKRVFSEDRRLEEVCRLLDSSTPLIIDVEQRAEMSDHEFVEEQEKILLQQVQIVLSASVGRAAFTLRTEKKYYSNLTTTIVLPKLCITGKCATKGTTIELNDTDVPTSYTSWPNFHNAVAAALSVRFNDSPADAWFAYNKATSQEGPEQAGMVLGFGLNGILNSMPPTLKHEHLARENSFTSMSILLGLAANLAGTGDMSTWKLISLHIGAMLPACTTELEIPRLATLVAPCALGLLFIGTHNSHIAKVLLGEISKRFSPLSVFASTSGNNSASNINTTEVAGVTSDREAHSLCAGFGLGFVSLGKGRVNNGNLIEDGLDGILRRFVVGGPKPAHMNPEDEDGFNQFGQTLPSMWEEYRCCHIEEGENVNVDVTTPSAIIAVALIYLRSGNEAVLRWLSPPRTLHLLDGVRPDLLMLRALALILVYEDVTHFDASWLEQNIMPEALLKHALRQPEKHSRLDHESINQAWASIVCGYSLGMGIRFAGTANHKVRKMLWHYTNLLLQVALPETKLSEYFPKNFLESCVCTLLISLSLIHSGTGDVAVLRLCRYLQSKVAATPITSSNNTYGLEMCISLATGILFLGGGAYSLSNDDRSIAVILASVFPKYPCHGNDNRYHLQSLRHLYVLAAQPRLILPKPMPYGYKLTFHIETTDGHTMKAAAPVLLPPFHLIRKIWMDNSEFLPVEFTLPEDLPHLKKIVEGGGCVNLVNKPIGYADYGFLRQMEWRQKHKFHSTFETDELTPTEELDEIKELNIISRTAVWNGMREIVSPLLVLRNGNADEEDWKTQIQILKLWTAKSARHKKPTCLTDEQILPLLLKAGENLPVVS